MANDSDKLLERLICVLPRDHTQPWHSMDDAYEANLWDIYPDIAVAAIGHDDTVIIDGCHAANVRWKCFTPVAYNVIESWKRLAARAALHTSGYAFLVGCILVGVLPGPLVGLGAVVLIYSLALIFASPYLIRILYGGKFWGAQPWLFGFEGYLDVECIERQIFGANLGRLSWSTFGSPLSRHHIDADGEYVADDPTTDPETMAMVQKGPAFKLGEQRLFTIVDTGSMTVTLFSAARPPIAFLLAGNEGGMQRAIGVSYDWTTETLYRETVLRMETPVIDAMFRIPRAKIGFKRGRTPVHHTGQPALEAV